MPRLKSYAISSNEARSHIDTVKAIKRLQAFCFDWNVADGKDHKNYLSATQANTLVKLLNKRIPDLQAQAIQANVDHHIKLSWGDNAQHSQALTDKRTDKVVHDVFGPLQRESQAKLKP